MNRDPNQLKLFLLNSALVNVELAKLKEESRSQAQLIEAMDLGREVLSYVAQFDHETRADATSMAPWYALFHMVENDIRKLIRETLEDQSGVEWWDSRVPESVRKEVEANQTREREMGMVPRSEDQLDYTTFGQLGDIIRDNWDIFGGILSNKKALGRTMSTLNALRGPIAHCGRLAPDEIDRLKLGVKDWFRVLAGPNNS